jgi:hypothetical protein
MPPVRYALVFFCVALGGCGFGAQNGGSGGGDDAAVDAAGGDAGSGSGSDGGSGAVGCWQHWLDHTPTIAAPVQLTALSTGAIERDPWISEDGKRLYFARRLVGASQTSDIYLTTRATADVPFADGDIVTNLSRANAEDGRPALSRDELTLALSGNLGGASKFTIRMIARNAGEVFGTPDFRHLAAVNSAANTDFYDPFLSADGLTLYLAPAAGGAQRVMVATRADVNGDFAAPVDLAGIAGGGLDADPAVSIDGRVIVFSSTRAGGAGGVDIYYATRATATATFGTPVAMPVVNGSANDGDPMLSADGCTLYFASNRGGVYRLYTATASPR